MGSMRLNTCREVKGPVFIKKILKSNKRWNLKEGLYE